MDEMRPPPDASWLKLDAPWYAEIRRASFGYSIRMTNGAMEDLDRWWAPTRRDAERKGRRMAARRNRTVETWQVS